MVTKPSYINLMGTPVTEDSFKIGIESAYETNNPESDLANYRKTQQDRIERVKDFERIELERLQAQNSQLSDFEPSFVNDILFNDTVSYYDAEQPTYIPSYTTTPSTFVEDFSDQYSLSYIGQMALYTKLDNDYLLGGYDPDFDPYEEENISGYEFYASKFQNVLNKKHMDVIKSVINQNTYTRHRLSHSDRWFWPALASGVLDPINLIALNPALRGATTFASRFKRGGTAVTGLVLPTELIRSKLDPTSTNLELAVNLGTSFAIGGLITGAIGKNVKGSYFDAIIPNPNGIKGVADDYNKAFNFWGADPSDYNWDYTPKYDVIGLIKKPLLVTNTKEPVRITKETKTSRSILKINKELLLNRWKAKTQEYKTKIGNITNFEKLEIKKAVMRDVWAVQKRKNETKGQFDARLENTALREFYGSRGERNTDTNMIGRFVEKFTNYGKVLNDTSIKNKGLKAFIQDGFFALSGDFATKSVAAKSGYSFNGSVALDIHANWDVEVLTLREIIDNAFVAYRKGVADKNRKNQSELLTYNLSKARIRAGDFYEKHIGSRFSNKDSEKIQFDQFKNTVLFRGIVDEKYYDNIISQDPVLKKAVDDLRKITARFHNENKKFELYATQEGVRSRKAYYTGLIIEVDSLIAKTKDETKLKEYKLVRDDLRAEVDMLNGFYNKANAFTKSDYFTPDAKTYLPLMLDIEEILNNKDAFIKFVAEKFLEPKHRLYVFKKNPITGREELIELDTSLEARTKRATKLANKLIDGDIDDVDGIFGKGVDKSGNVAYGVSPFKRRVLNFEHSSFLKENNGIADFVITDVDYLLRQYITRDSMAIETAKRFGDPHLRQFTFETKIKFITDEVTSEQDVSNMNKIVSLFLDEHNKMRGTLSTEDPSSIGKRGAAFLRDWTSLAVMGKVIYSATVDAGRPIMVNGFRKTFGVGLNNFITNQEGYFRAIDNLRYMGVAAEVALGMARKRFIEDGGQIGKASSKLGRWFDRQAARVHNFQATFYTINGLTPWTQMMKDFQGVISAHRFIEDSVAWSKNDLDVVGQQRLLSYGIDKKTADLFAKMPYEDLDGLLTANTNKWGSRKGGLVASRKFKEALYADINRTIITPSSADQLNMMHGVIKVRNPNYVDFFDSSKVAKFVGFQKTDYGGQFSNAWVGLPFQFFSWGIAANRRLVISGMQGREQNAVMGMLAMVTLGMMADRMKNKRAWQNKSTEEKMIRAVEQSGVLGIFSDLNFMAETISGGLTGQPIGLRPLLGVEPRFGDANVMDATGEFVGAGPSLLLDAAYMFGSDSTFDERRNSARRLLPLQNLWLWDEKFKSIYNKRTNFLRRENNDNS